MNRRYVCWTSRVVAPTADSLIEGKVRAECDTLALDHLGAHRQLDIWLAVSSGVVLSLVAIWLAPRVADDPFSVRGSALPVALAALSIIIGSALVLALLVRPPLAGRACAIGTGILAGWVTLTLRAAVYGTPYGFGRWDGDSGRVAAMATRYATTVNAGDPLAVSVPHEYPPLYPWLIGRAAAWLGADAWRLMSPAAALSLAASVVCSFVLWRRVCSAPLSLALSSMCLLAFHSPAKSYVVLAIAVFVPWLMQVFGSPPGGRLHWLPAGLVLGLIIVTYYGPFVLCAFGLIVLVLGRFRRVETRLHELRYLGSVAAVGLAVSGWYWIPMISTWLNSGAQSFGDLYASDGLLALPAPLDDSPAVIVAIQLVGLLGCIAWRRTHWWAAPIATVALGLWAYWALMMALFAATGHTMLFHYVARVLDPLLAGAGVLVLAHCGPLVISVIGRRIGRPVGVAALATLSIWAATSMVLDWMPSRDPAHPNDAAFAFAQTLPDGSAPTYGTGQPLLAGFPADRVTQLVEPGSRPLTLSTDERLFAHLPWPGYMAVDRTGSNRFSNWQDRYDEVRTLASSTSATEFSAAAATMVHGSIDVFVLAQHDDGWYWRDIAFRPELFLPEYFEVTPDLPAGLVVAVRRP